VSSTVSFGGDFPPGTPPGRVMGAFREGEHLPSLGLGDYLAEQEAWRIEIARRRATRPPGTPDWLMALGDRDYAIEIRRRSEP
jgi:hypothetical protein